MFLQVKLVLPEGNCLDLLSAGLSTDQTNIALIVFWDFGAI